MATMTISLPENVVNRINSEVGTGKFATRSEFFRDLLRKYFSGVKNAYEAYESRPLDEVRLELARNGKYSEKFINSVVSGLKKSSFYAN